MKYSLIFLSIFFYCYCERCRIFCSTTPCFTTVLTNNIYSLEVFAENSCSFDLLMSGDITPLESILFENQVLIKPNKKIENYTMIIQSFLVKYGEKSCSLNPVFGNTHLECIGNSNNTYEVIDLEQIFSLYNFLTNDYYEIEITKKTNVSIIRDFNTQIEIIHTYLQKITSNKNDEIIGGSTYTIPNSASSTYSINGVIQPNDNLINLPFNLNYNFLNGTYEYCSYYTLTPQEIKPIFNIYCDSCIVKTDKYIIKNLPIIENKICKDIINLGRSIENNTIRYTFSLTLTNNKLLDTSIYKNERKIVKKVNITLTPYLNYCLIKIINITDDTELLFCNLLGRTTQQILYEKLFNGNLFLYKRYIYSLVACVNTVFDCGTTKVNIINIPKFEIEKIKDVIINNEKSIESKIGWWLLFKKFTSIAFWTTLIDIHFVGILTIHLIIFIITIVYINRKIKKVHQHLDYIELTKIN